MRLLTFKIGPARLALKVDSVISVELDKKADGLKRTAGLRVDLANILGLTAGEAANKALIKCRHQDKLFELSADEVLGLEDVSPSRHLAWPGVLAFMKNYTGVVLTSGQTFLALDLDSVLTGLKK
ncbi:MAG: hypothetical protein Q7W05_06680 [Deltaproteobacteria bacterium]|nr:hypothetical protein [Deltaproteobacteria bacterium]